MGKIFEKSYKDADFAFETTDDGSVDVKVSYPVYKLEAPLVALLQKLTAKVPFLQAYLPAAISALFSSLGVKGTGAPVVGDQADAANGPAVVSDALPADAAAAPAIEPVHQA